MGIVEEDIARVRAATDFVALASEHLALRRVGRNWSGLCPFHVEKSPSFSLNAGDGVYYCFGCGARGDAITFVREIEHLDFAEAVEKLAARAGITLRYDDEATGRDHRRRAAIHDTLERAIEWYHQRLLSSADAAGARRYLRSERGYDGEVVRRYRLGWAPEAWDAFARASKIATPALLDAGLAQVSDEGRHFDFFRARVLFPIFDPGGRPIGAGGRALPGGRPPKYKNTPSTAVYDKSRVLYGLNWAKQAVVSAGEVVVCEGYTDVIGFHLAGVGQAVATCGTALADGHVRAITNFARRIVLAYDADAAGQAAAERFYAWERRYEVDIRVAALPPGQDPADLARRDPGKLVEAIGEARPYLAFQLDRLFSRSDLASAEGRARAAASAVELVRAHPDDLVRDQYLMEVADRCRVDAARLRDLRPPPQARAVAGEVAGRTGDGTAGAARDAPRLPALPGPERAALGVAISQPADIAGRLDPVLFSHPVSRAAYEALAAAETLHDAIDAADPVAAELITRLAVADSADSADDVMVRLLEVASDRELEELRRDMRAAPAGGHRQYVEALGWLKLAREALRTPDGAPACAPAGPDPDRVAEQTLIEWLTQSRNAREALTAGDGP